jgi:2-amino-4-hydroxy-6-hydroxymethyldihydropteridine diphosphokinase
MAVVYVGLGSNMGNQEQNLASARRIISAHGGLTIVKKSSIIETKPVDYLNQPPFLNQIVIIATDMTPRDLLSFFKTSEADMGRKKTIPKGPRVIDIDILLYDDIILVTDDLVIPHPEIKNRPFILQHLHELSPDMIDPITKKPFNT